MTPNFIRIAAAAAAIALTAGATTTAVAGESTLGERFLNGYTAYQAKNATNGSETKTTNTAERYLRGSGASEPAGAKNVTPGSTPPAQTAPDARYLRGSGISSGPSAQ